MQRMSELFNVNVFIVSQTNPWYYIEFLTYYRVIPFLDSNEFEGLYHYEKRKFNFWKLLKSLVASEIKHRLNQVKIIIN